MQRSVETKGNVFVGGARRSWQDIDRDLRSIAKRQRALDAEEAVLLCEVVRREIWRQLGRASMHEYLEHVLGYGPKAASERVRVALALDELPMLAEALARGAQSYSAIKELTRVATAQTQAEWCNAARGKNVRQVEEMVAGRRRGDRPTDPADPDLRPQVVRFELTTAMVARLRQVQQVLANEHAAQLDDNALFAALCDAVLDGHAAGEDGGCSRHQILTTVCSVCSQAWQHGGGRDFAIDSTELAIAECDAQRVGSDREVGTAAQDVAPKVRRFVTLRDRMRCTVPGCRAARHIDVHHVVPRHLGGGHEAENLTLLCAGHHRALHEGHLTLTGRAPDLVVEWRDSATEPAPHVEPEQPACEESASRYELAVLRTEAIRAIDQLGYMPAEAREFVDKALECLPRAASLEDVLRAALRVARDSMVGASRVRESGPTWGWSNPARVDPTRAVDGRWTSVPSRGDRQLHVHCRRWEHRPTTRSSRLLPS